MNKFIIVVLLTLSTCIPLFPSNPVKVVHNTRKEIDACMGKVQLTLVQTWGGDEEEDDDRIFKDPEGVVVDKNGNVYVSDFGRHQVKVFDKNGKYLRTLGRRGNGPTDILNPADLTMDTRGNLVISDQANMRVQVLSPEGKYIGGFKFLSGWISDFHAAHKRDEIVIYSYKKTFLSRKLLSVYDMKGKILREIGKYVNSGEEIYGECESIDFDLDENDTIYTAYYGTPYLLVFSYAGDVSMLITYEMPYESPKVSFDNVTQNIVIKGEPAWSGCAISVDNQKIYLVTPKRLRTEKERKEGGGYSVSAKGGGETINKKPEIDSENTDLYRLLVFNPSGKIIAAAQLNVYCNKIYVNGNRLFIIDMEKAFKIFEFKMTFK